jgi:ribosomal protein S27AE
MPCWSRTYLAPFYLWERIRPVLKNRANLCSGTRCRKLSPGQGQQMESVVEQQTPYQCGRCGATNVLAAPLVYQQGTHTYSTRFRSGTTQSFSAQAAAPPDPRGYGRPLVLWAIPICFTFFWGLVGLIGIIEHSKAATRLGSTVAILLLLGIVSIGRMVLTFRRIARYNRTVYPRLRWNWEHTYICRRCGNSQLILS